MKKIIIIIFSNLLLSACGNFFKEKHAASDVNTGANLTLEKITFADVRDKIFIPKCVECHMQYADYNFVKQDLNGILRSITQNRMPKNQPPLSNDLKQLLNIWVEQGTANTPEDGNNQQPSPEEEGLQANWDSLYKNIFVPKCVICHSPNGQAPWIDLTNRSEMTKSLIPEHIDFQKPEESNLIFRLSHKEEPMPPLPPFSNIPQLTAEEVQVVIEWIKKGLP